MSQAFGALRQMGFRETDTKRALASLRSHVGLKGDLEETIRAALQVLTS